MHLVFCFDPPNFSHRCCHDSAEEDVNGSCYSDNGVDDNPISSSSNEAPANPAGMVPLLPQSSKPQANQRVKSKRPESSGEFLYALSF